MPRPGPGPRGSPACAAPPQERQYQEKLEAKREEAKQKKRLLLEQERKLQEAMQAKKGESQPPRRPSALAGTGASTR